MLRRSRFPRHFRILSVATAVCLVLACQGGVTPDLENQPDTDGDSPPGDTPSAEVSADAGGPYAALRESPTITVNGGGTSDPDDRIVEYFWDFGDGTTGRGETVEHNYQNTVAEYTVTLTVRDAESVELDNDTTTARIRERPQPSFEVVTATEDIVVGSQIEFDADASDDGDGLGCIAEYCWDFDYQGDFSAGMCTSQPVTTYTWSSGTFPRDVRVALRVVDDDEFESIDIATSDITVKDSEGVRIIIE